MLRQLTNKQLEGHQIALFVFIQHWIAVHTRLNIWPAQRSLDVTGSSVTRSESSLRALSLLAFHPSKEMVSFEIDVAIDFMTLALLLL